MFKELLNHPDLMIWPILGLLICFSVMLGAYFWAYRPKAKAFYQQMAFKVFDDQERSRHGN